jgi:hypothetical protein
VLPHRKEDLLEMTYGYRMAWWACAGGALAPLVCVAAWALMTSMELSGAAAARQWLPEAALPAALRPPLLWWRLGVGGVLWIGLAAMMFISFARRVLLVRRGWVAIEDDGIRSSDWRGRESSIGWGEVQRVRVCSILSEPRVQIVTASAKVSLGPGLAEADSLVQTILGRRELQLADRRWWGAIYRGPAWHSSAEAR